ncbi:MAG: hypothetical protein B6I24_10495, partial [Bacteroidetes bacterium 4572_128]
MIKKIMYYKTLSPTEMYISIERLSYILFGFSGKFENVDDAKKLCNDFFLKKGEILKNDQILKKSFFYFFDDLHFISAIPIQNLPRISYKFAERIETSQTEILNFYQNKVKNLQKTQPAFLRFLLELNDKVDKLMVLPDDKLSEEKKKEFDHLMVHAFDKSDGYGMTYRVPYFKGRQKFLKVLDKETS